MKIELEVTAIDGGWKITGAVDGVRVEAYTEREASIPQRIKGAIENALTAKGEAQKS